MKIPKSRIRSEERERLAREHTAVQRRLKVEFYKRRDTKSIKEKEQSFTLTPTRK